MGGAREAVRYPKFSWAKLGTGHHGCAAHVELDPGAAKGTQSSEKGQSQMLNNPLEALPVPWELQHFAVYNHTCLRGRQ